MKSQLIPNLVNASISLVHSIIFVALLLPTWSLAQEKILTTLPQESKFTGVTVGFQNFSFLDASDAHSYQWETTVGIPLNDRWQIGFSLGKLNSERLAKGGNLEDWQYVEKEWSVEGDYWVAEIKNKIWKSVTGGRSVVVNLGYGDISGKLTYDYNRYKPNNGSICFPFGCSDKALEEGAWGQANAMIRFYRVGAVYSWDFGKPVIGDHMIFYLGVHYFRVLDPQSPTVGTTRQSVVSTDMIGSTTSNLGIAFVF